MLNIKILLTGVLIASTAVLAGPSHGPINWDHTYGDSITGDNEFLSGNNHYWFVNTGADVYDIDIWERPNAQTDTAKSIDQIIGSDAELAQLYTNGQSPVVNGSSDPSYHAYLDIVSGSYALGKGDDSDFMFFGIELYGNYKAGTNGDRNDDYVFGDGTQYRVRMSNDSEGANGLMIGSDAGTDYSKGDYDSWSTKKNYGWFDKDGEVGGNGGIATPNEGVNKGYQTEEVIKSDGKTANGDKEVLWTRYRHDSNTGRSYVEFALDLVTLENKSNVTFDPTNIGDLVFETTRGLKDENEYLWNDAYNESQAGSPYTLASENIYELDNLRVGAPNVPVPGALLLGSIGCAIVGYMRRRTNL